MVKVSRAQQRWDLLLGSGILGCRSQWCFLVAGNEIFSGFNLEMKSGRLKVRRPRTLRINTMQI